jgi:predicted glycosyltransferase
VIGWYAHHQGRGHLTRAAVVLAELDRPVTVLTSAPDAEVTLPGVPLVRLPLDVHDGPTPAALHYAPLGSPGLRARMAAIAAWIEQARPDLLVVDVSVEVTALVRLLGVPVVVVRQHGDRRDPAHRLGYDLAVALLAPYPPALEDPTATPHDRARTRYTGLFSRFDGRVLARADARAQLRLDAEDRLVVVLNGAGGPGCGPAAVQAARAATPGWRWLLLGGSDGHDRGADADWVADPYAHLRAADVVVAGGGHNSVAEVMAADRPLVCVPEDRPFGEQGAKATALAAVGAAIVAPTWPVPTAWPEVLAEALQLDPGARRRLIDGTGARRAAAEIAALADDHAHRR